MGVGVTSTGIVTAAGLASSAVVTVTGAVKATSFETTSDARFKQNITAISGDRLRNLLDIQGVSFQWRREEFPERSFGNETMFGFLAQDVERYFPEIVRRDANGWRRIQSGAFEPLLHEALRQHDARMARLEEANRALEEENLALRDRIASVEEENLAIRRDLDSRSRRDASLDARVAALER